MKSSFPSDSGLAAVLQRVFYYENHAGVTVRDVASLTGKHERQVYHLISGDRKPDLEFLRQLSHYMIDRHCDDRIASYFLPDGFVVIRNAESERAKIARVLQIVEDTIMNLIQALLMGNELPRTSEMDELIRLLHVLLNRNGAYRADEGAG